MRQAVITVYESTGDGQYSPEGYDIFFRQPWNYYGLAFNFSFEKDYFSPIADCELSIFNTSNEIDGKFTFDPSSYRGRPKIEIRAGDTKEKLIDRNKSENWKQSLPLVYTGVVYYFTKNLQQTENSLSLQLTDISLLSSTYRANGAFFRGGTPVMLVLRKLLSQIDGLEYGFDPLLESKYNELLDRDCDFTGQFIIREAVRRLALQYGFIYFFSESGSLTFAPRKQSGKTEPQEITPETGMIGHPDSINFNHYNVKTVYGKPDIFLPKQWVSVKSNSLDGGELYGLIIKAAHQWDDSEAHIVYTVSPSGSPVEHTPVLRF